jgi:hypothetical protein
MSSTALFFWVIRIDQAASSRKRYSTEDFDRLRAKYSQKQAPDFVTDRSSRQAYMKFWIFVRMFEFIEQRRPI